MNTLSNFVPTSEAAYIAGISDRDMNRVMDEHILPDVLFQGASGRSFARLGAAFASFYFETEDIFSAQFRRNIVSELTSRVESRSDKEDVFSLSSMPKDADWHIDVSRVTSVNVADFVDAALGRTRQIEQANSLVETDPKKMGGQPVFTGTRLPIANILSSLDSGIDLDRMQASYPFLTDAHINAARVYNRVHPKRGRPAKLAESNPEWTVKSSRVVRPATPT